MLLAMAKKKPEVDEAEMTTADAAPPPAEMPPIPPPEAAPVLTDTEVSAEIPAFEPPPWKPSAGIIPPWVIAARRVAWKVKTVETPKTERRAQWTGGDIEYTYFKGGTVVARFREGGFYGLLEVEPVAAFEKDPEVVLEG